MADSKISALTAVAAAAAGNEYAINESGTTKKITNTQIFALLPDVGTDGSRNITLGSATLDTGTFTMIKGAQSGDPQFSISLTADANGDVSLTADTGDITIDAVGGELFLLDDNVQMGSATVDTGTLTLIKGAQTSDPQTTLSMSADGVGDFIITTANGSDGDIHLLPSGGTVEFGADDAGVNIDIHSAGTITFRDDSDDTVVVFGPVFDGTTSLSITGNLVANDAAGPAFLDKTPTATVPTLSPNRTDTDTGIGWVSADVFTLISGGVEGIRIAENTTITTTITGAVVNPPDEITATDAGVAASIATVNTEVTTNDDDDLDNVTLANGVSGQVKHIYCVVSFAGDTWKITPATMAGGTQISFGDNSVGNGCTLVYADNEGWVVVANNGGTIS